MDLWYCATCISCIYIHLCLWGKDLMDLRYCATCINLYLQLTILWICLKLQYGMYQFVYVGYQSKKIALRCNVFKFYLWGTNLMDLP